MARYRQRGQSFPVRVWNALLVQVARLDTSFNPNETLAKLHAHQWTKSDIVYPLQIINALFWLKLMESPAYPYKLLIPLLYTIALLLPITSQFFLPATPIFSWLITFYSSKYVPVEWRPEVSVTTLPTLEYVLYGGNISDILTRYTHPFLDVIAWMSYGVLHFILPFVVAAFLWLFSPPIISLKYWAACIGYLNLIGVLIQNIFPCAPPWYEVIYGLTPATYDTPGSAAGLARIDSFFGTTGYQTTFSNAPIAFGAFPSLHSSWATIEALFITHFFPYPWVKRLAWGYAGILYWATMYLTHHYLIDVVGGSCLAVAFFYGMMPDEVKYVDSEGRHGEDARRNGYAGIGRRGVSKVDAYDLERRGASSSRRNGGVYPLSPSDSLPSSGRNSPDPFGTEEQDITFTYAARSPRPPGSAAFVPSPLPGESGSGWPGVARNPGVDKVTKLHKHTASIASLIRAEERTEGGWSPITATFPNGSGPSTKTSGNH